MESLEIAASNCACVATKYPEPEASLIEVKLRLNNFSPSNLFASRKRKSTPDKNIALEFEQSNALSLHTKAPEQEYESALHSVQFLTSDKSAGYVVLQPRQFRIPLPALNSSAGHMLYTRSDFEARASSHTSDPELIALYEAAFFLNAQPIKIKSLEKAWSYTVIPPPVKPE
jgi:hypothetical protein